MSPTAPATTCATSSTANALARSWAGSRSSPASNPACGAPSSGTPSATQVQVHTSAINGLLIVDLPLPGDNRGWFEKNRQRAKAVDVGLPELVPLQNNISFDGTRGTTRGIHAEPWDKYVPVATGSISGAWVDLRRGTGFGTVITHEITPSTAVFVSRGVGNAFQSLEDATAYTRSDPDLANADGWLGDVRTVEGLSRYRGVINAAAHITVDAAPAPVAGPRPRASAR